MTSDGPLHRSHGHRSPDVALTWLRGHWPSHKWHMMPVGAVPSDWACPASPNPSHTAILSPSSVSLSRTRVTRSHDESLTSLNVDGAKIAISNIYQPDILAQPLILASPRLSSLRSPRWCCPGLVITWLPLFHLGTQHSRDTETTETGPRVA